MKFRLLVVFPFAFAALFAVVATLAGQAALGSVLVTENEVGKLAALVGCFAAALAFESGDYLRRAWFFSGLCYLLLLAADVVGMPSFASHLSDQALDLTQGVLVVVANATSVAGTWMLAHAWSVAGLEDDRSRGAGRLLFGGAILLALAITGWPLLLDVRTLLAGDFGAVVSIASDLGDTICLALIAPVMQTALAMRGGVLRWPWGLLTSSGIAWLAYDASSALHLEHRWLVLSEALRALACGAFLSAGIAQRLAVAPDTRSAG
jgi:hypothetical protein